MPISTALQHCALTLESSGYAPTPLDLAHISFDDEDDLQLLQEGVSPVAQDRDDAVDREAGSSLTHQSSLAYLTLACFVRRCQGHRRQQRPERAAAHDAVQ